MKLNIIKIHSRKPISDIPQVVGNYSIFGCCMLINLASDGVLKVALYEDISP